MAKSCSLVMEKSREENHCCYYYYFCSQALLLLLGWPGGKRKAEGDDVYTLLHYTAALAEAGPTFEVKIRRPGLDST